MGWSISIHLITMDKMKQQYWIQFLLNRMWTKQDFSSGRSVFLSIWSGARHETSLEVILYHNKRDAPLNMPQKKSWRMCSRSDYWRLAFLYKFRGNCGCTHIAARTPRRLNAWSCALQFSVPHPLRERY